MDTQLAVVQQENIQLIVSQAPVAFKENQISHDRCIEFGQRLLQKIEASGMTDELDQEAATFIDRARKTVVKMNEKRSPVTKIFDVVRSAYTSMENEVDPSKPSTIPNRLQALRNEYAAKKRAEAEAKRREEERRMRIESAKKKYRSDVEMEFKQSFNRYLNNQYNELNRLNSSVTLENFSIVLNQIRTFPVELTEEALTGTIFRSNVVRPVEVEAATLTSIVNDVAYQLKSQFCEQYKFEMESNRDNILELLPSKKMELEAIQKSGEEEAARRKYEMQKREAEEAKRREEERIRKEQEEKQRMELKEKQAQACSLFDSSIASVAAYQPKTQVKKKVVVTDPRGFLDIINLWWVEEGAGMSVDELAKKLKFMVTTAEKAANDKKEPRTIESQYVIYEDEVKAK